MSLISGNVTFGADAINCSSSSILGAAAFIDTASNQGTVSVASFSNTAVNEGTVVSAVFSDGAVNVGSLTSGTFLGTAVNSGVVDVAEFFGTASNVGVIVEAAKFADTSSNVGVVSGSAIFADTSVSNGVVEGAVQLGVNVTEGENQALTETPTEYTQTDGFFPNAYYEQGAKTYPPNYQTVVYKVGQFWYQYDIVGVGSIANGIYSDGTSVANGGDAIMFVFLNGVKGSQKSIAKTINGTNYFYTGTIGNGTILYTDAALTSLATNLVLNAGDLNSNEIDDLYVTNGQGQVTIEYGKQTSVGGYYYYGTIENANVLYGDQFTTVANLASYTLIGDNNNDNSVEYVRTDNVGIICEVRGPQSVELNGTNYYYPLLVCNDGSDIVLSLAQVGCLYNDQMLTGHAICKNVYGDVNNDGIYDHVVTDASACVTVTCGQSTVLGGTTYYHIGAFGNNTELYSDASLETLATGLNNVNVGDISDPADGYDDCVSTDNLGIVSICYGQEEASNCCICLGNNTYYYTGTLSNGNTLYSNNALTCLATCVLGNAGDLNDDTIADFICADLNGIICTLSGQCYEISASPFYSFQGLGNGVFLYTDSNLTCLAADVTLKMTDQNSDGTSDFATISNGILCYINGSCVNGLGYYTGVATSIGNSYYSDNVFENKLGTFSDCCVDINSDAIIDSVQITDGNLVQVIVGRTATIDSCTFYWLSAGAYDCAACLAGETLYSNGALTATLSSACMNIGNDQYLCTDSDGLASIV